MPSELPDSFGCGPFVTTRNPDVSLFVDKLNKMREAVDSCRLQSGVGYDVQRSAGGTTLTIRSKQASAAPFEHPFKLKVRAKDKTTYEYWANQGVVGDGKIKTSNIEQWVEFKDPVRIYLEATLEDLAITNLKIKTQNPDDILYRTVIEDGKQTFSRITLGLYVHESKDSKNYKLIQNVTTDIMTPLFCYSGYPALAMTQEYVNAYYT